MNMVVSKYELNITMDDDFSQLFCTESPLNLGIICPPAMMGRSSEQHKFEPAKLFGITSTHPPGSPPSALHATESYMGFDQNEHRVGNSPASYSQFPASDLHIVSCKSSGYNFFTAERAGSNFDFRDTLQSLVKSQLCIDQSNSSSEKSNKIPCNNMTKLSSHDENMLLADQNITLVRRELPVPSDSNQGLNVCHSSSYTPAPSKKRRVRWTQDLHEKFVQSVNLLGGAQKATPKAILKLMDTNLLTILHVKSHLQNYRTAKYIPASSQEKSERKSSAKGIPEIPMQISMQMKEALQLQLEVERHLHEQLELQQNLQSLIEEESRQLKMIFDQHQKRYKSPFKSQNSQVLSPNGQHTSPEDAQFSIGEVSGNTHFPS
ncbi:protein PHR1-LIKE 1-like isoform X2 [Juglans microcarpa x Juglans regia]|uniref:protein PHR1-LIKE 1-like isoform X2 n=1 Tax=Juglans microcarpa x Juglans regia TaxID=2249226 RepID=UPI001B7F54B5|nr:protein PHR1-LIKE 1-like isoform X2 [Juglans microcarpa x Juglans regia]